MEEQGKPNEEAPGEEERNQEEGKKTVEKKKYTPEDAGLSTFTEEDVVSSKRSPYSADSRQDHLAHGSWMR
ncbi:Hypothetical predicted protein [Octopus vulgaris]|uniref:Uncharacterized protein n=1 Tax=Octopus vulgaris TaxID=6645 RepID=A0AA36F3C4_OCTVU|nr:Hypothetical predicted protein [Octopus vulgaris]